VQYDLERGQALATPEQRIIDTIDQPRGQASQAPSSARPSHTPPTVLGYPSRRTIVIDAAAALIEYLSGELAQGSQSAQRLLTRAQEVQRQRAEVAAAVPIVLSHLDRIAQTEEERAYVQQLITARDNTPA
jgi:hypothetical protein